MLQSNDQQDLPILHEAILLQVYALCKKIPSSSYYNDDLCLSFASTVPTESPSPDDFERLRCSFTWLHRALILAGSDADQIYNISICFVEITQEWTHAPPNDMIEFGLALSKSIESIPFESYSEWRLMFHLMMAYLLQGSKIMDAAKDQMRISSDYARKFPAYRIKYTKCLELVFRSPEVCDNFFNESSLSSKFVMMLVNDPNTMKTEEYIHIARECNRNLESETEQTHLLLDGTIFLVEIARKMLQRNMLDSAKLLLNAASDLISSEPMLEIELNLKFLKEEHYAKSVASQDTVIKPYERMVALICTMSNQGLHQSVVQSSSSLWNMIYNELQVATRPEVIRVLSKTYKCLETVPKKPTYLMDAFDNEIMKHKQNTKNGIGNYIEDFREKSRLF